MTEAIPRALVVEDDRSWQAILSELLQDAGLAVDLASDAETALELLRAQQHRIAVVDLSLAGEDHSNQDGLRVLEAVRLHDPGCVALLLTGFATVELAVSVLTEYGGYTCLQKERFQRSEFRDLLRRALANPAAYAHPAHQPGLDEPARPARPDPHTAPAHGRALLVEDDAGWRSILSELLTDAGYTVRACAGYGEALGCLRSQTFDLATIDLSLAHASAAAPPEELDGFRLLASTRLTGIPTIVVSGVAGPAEIERAYSEQGIFAYLEKQAFDRRAFLRVIEEAAAAGASSPALRTLTGRERQVLRLLAQGQTNKEIAQTLIISDNTVKRHLKAIFRKLDVHTRAAAVALARDEA